MSWSSPNSPPPSTDRSADRPIGWHADSNLGRTDAGGNAGSIIGTDYATQQEQQQEQAESEGYYRMTPDEVRVMRHCRAESFWYRVVPLSAISVGGVALLKRMDIIKKRPLPHTLTALFVSYMVGKLSYAHICIERIRQLPNSPMAERLRRGDAGHREALNEFARIESPNLPTFSKYDDVDQSNFNESGGVGSTPQPRSGGGPPDFYNAEFSLPPGGQQANPEGDSAGFQRPRYTTTYDDLRKQNREEYAAKQKDQFKQQFSAQQQQKDQSKPAYMQQISVQQQQQNLNDLPVARPKSQTQPFFTDRDGPYGDIGFEGGQNKV